MTKILDFLVDNYLYVAGISGFFIVVLIGFLSKNGKNKTKKEDAKKTESEEITNNNYDNFVVAPIETNANTITVEPIEGVVKEPIDLTQAIQATENFEVVLENKPAETLDFGEHVVLNKEKLDDEVDIIDFSSLNAFKSNDEIAQPK